MGAIEVGQMSKPKHTICVMNSWCRRWCTCSNYIICSICILLYTRYVHTM